MITYIWNFVFNIFGILPVMFISYIYNKDSSLKNFLTESVLSATLLLIQAIFFSIYLIFCLLYLFDIFTKKDFSLKNLIIESILSAT